VTSSGTTRRAGIWRSVWILMLIFLPFLGALVCLIARAVAE
jgi:hypothetical protein